MKRVLWLLAFVLLCNPAFAVEDLSYLKKVEKATFDGFYKLFEPATGLPVDIASIAGGDVRIVPEDKNFSKTSPTNIGLGFTFLVLARDRGYLPEEKAYAMALRMMDMMEKLESHEGFLFNWYYLSGEKGKIPAVTMDRFISSLDNGDLDVCLMAAAGAFPGTELETRITAFLKRHDYHFFFDKNPSGANGMINVGYDEAKKVYSGSDYSILNIEGRMTVIAAIMMNGLAETAWKKQTRLVRYYKTQEGETIPIVAAWGGSLYETMFADEILGGRKIAPEAFGKNAAHMLRIHIDKGKQISESGIWGLSNGEVPGTGRYEMAGVNEIAFNRFPGEFITVYSSFLALRYGAEQVVENFKKIEKLNPKAFSENFGFTDSIDPKTGVINERILSLDKGMEVLAIGNYMNARENKKEIPDYFWAYAEKQGWKEKGQALIKAEEQHPAFKALAGSGQQAEEEPALPPVDLIEVRQEAGAFAETGRGHASMEFTGDNRINIQYDVSQRYTYSGIFIKYDDPELSQRRFVTFQIKGGEGFPKTVKVEMKFRGEYVQFDHVELKKTWSDVKIRIPDGAEKFDELTFVIENAVAGDSPKGDIQIRSVTLR